MNQTERSSDTDSPVRKPYFDSVREVIAIVWTEASPFVRLRLVSVLGLVIAASVLTSLGPLALKMVVDGFTHETRGIRVSAFTLILLYVLSQFAARTVGEVRGLIYARAERRMLRTLSERLFAHLMQLPLRIHLDRETGGISQTLENGLQGYQMVLHHLVFTFLPVMAELGTIIVVLTRLAHAAFLGLFCGVLVCYALAFAFAARATSKVAKTASAARIQANAQMTDAILNYEVVKCFAAESLVQQKVSQALAHSEREWVGFYKAYARNGMAVATIYAAFLSATILYASYEVSLGRLTVGDFVLVNSYMLQLVRPVEMLGYAAQAFSQGVAMLERMLALLREQSEPQQGLASLAPGGPAALEFDRVTLSLRSDRPIVKDLSFKVPAGKTLGIVGPTGAGKSTIVRLLVRLFEPDAGHIYLDNVRISTLSLPELRRSIAVVPQDTVLFNESIRYNISFGRPGCTQEEVEKAARLAHLHEFILSLPDGYNTRVGERGVKLSGGERQRVSIARAAVKRPRIYVFDEATSSLDPATEAEILRNIREISRFSTTVVITHRLSMVVHADEIAVLEEGELVERGTHAYLLRSGGRYAALWHAQNAGAVAA